jgi:hypothetical protein
MLLRNFVLGHAIKRFKNIGILEVNDMTHISVYSDEVNLSEDINVKKK